MQEMVKDPLLFFLMSAVYGVCVLLFYDIFRALRSVFDHIPFFLIIEDLGFSIFVAITSFAFLCTYNGGEVRSYFFLGIFSGMFLYHIKISKTTVKILKSLFCLIKNLMCRITDMIMHPLIHIQRNIKWRLKKEKKNVTMALKRQTRRGGQDGRKETIK